MNVLFVTAEADPYAKVGGLADVAGSLPVALRANGVDARVIMPLYAFIDQARWGISYLLSFDVHRRTGTIHVDLYTATHKGVPIYFVRALPYFGQEATVYSNWDYDVPRFMFFCQAALDAAAALRDQQGWFPDIFHVHDWHTGLVPFLLSQKRSEWGWGHVGSMVTIHNMQYQGEHIGGWAWEQGIPGRDHPELQARGLSDNMLAIALAYSDMITSVSPRYAVEIQYPNAGFGLQDLIRNRLTDVRGILNGLDMNQWNPATDPLLESNYSADDFVENRPPNKRQLQAEANLQVDDNIPVIGMVTRLVQQKGLDLALPALRTVLAKHDVQFVGIGSGEPEYNELFFRLGADFHWKAKCFLGYNATVAQRIYSGCDIFLMPSHFEPCGIGQMIAMRYGALPLVRETGGLADTVMNYDDGEADFGTGFVFNWEEPQAVVGTLDWALWTYRNRKNAWRRMQDRAMRVDFSWDKSAREYSRLYGWIQDRHK
jgi:starch synthase